MQAIGEVLSSTITGFNAEAWKGELLSSSLSPSFGSFLKCKSEESDLCVYGVVYDIITGPQDQMHRPAALGLSRDRLRKEQPQIFLLLKTEWQAATVAYRRNGRLRCGLPPFPPQVHDFVYPLNPEETREVSDDLEFLHMLSGLAPGVQADELLAAAIRNAAGSRPDEYQYLVLAGQQVSRILRDDYERLGALLRKIHPLRQKNQ